MGLDINAVLFLIQAKRQGVSFRRVLTIGRQDLNVFPEKLIQVLKREGFPYEKVAAAKDQLMHADPFFEVLGSTELQSLDVSSFEAADLVHDLNQPVPKDYHGRYDVVYDGGTLEHIFHFPVALKNCMEMVKPGGRLILHTVTNNYCGHGFYQLSPELFFRALNSDNGFIMERMILHRMGPYGAWYEVTDPERIHSRVELITLSPVQLLVQARREELRPVFAKVPQQSDYTPRWDDKSENRGQEAAGANSEAGTVEYRPVRSSWSAWAPGLARLLHGLKTAMLLLYRHSLFNRNCVRKVSKQCRKK